MEKPVIHYENNGVMIKCQGTLKNAIKTSWFQSNVTRPKCLELIKQFNNGKL